jgi:cytochrome c553
MVNQCLKCHDTNGAASIDAQVPTSIMSGAMAAKPFGTNTPYTGVVGVTAGGVTGGVVDVNESFKTSNSSYHPVKGKQNNWYAKSTRMVAPWNSARGASVNTTSYGYLLSCWDCHAPNGTPMATVLNGTVTAHGGATTVRGAAATYGTSYSTAPPAAGAVTLCAVCHSGYDTSTLQNHNGGSAFGSASSTNSGMVPYLRYACNACHSSLYSMTALQTRPTRAQDVHGVNAFPSGGQTKSGRWATAGQRPWAFIRNTTTLANHQPSNIAGTAYSPSCSTATPFARCNDTMGSYTVGGVY